MQEFPKNPVNNPIVFSPFVANSQIQRSEIPPQEFLITEDGNQIVAENGTNLITE